MPNTSAGTSAERAHSKHLPGPAVAAIILSGGASSRMCGRPKALIEIAGQSLMARLVHQLQEAGVSGVYVVTGAHDEAIAPVFAELVIGLKIPGIRIHNTHWAEGPGTSLRAGLNAALTAERAFDGFLVTPVDLPCTRTADWKLLLDCFALAGKTVAVAHGDGCEPGAPVVLAHGDARTLQALNEAGGAKGWLKSNLERIHCLGCAPLTWDADTPAALKALGEIESAP